MDLNEIGQIINQPNPIHGIIQLMPSKWWGLINQTPTQNKFPPRNLKMASLWEK